jgi:iron(III) transport system permease protein
MEMGTYFFVNSMMTISAVSFLSPTRIKPVSLMITQFEATMQLESAAFVSLLILCCNFFLKGIIYAIRRHVRNAEGLP